MIPLANNSDTSASFWLGPYSSGLTGSMSPFANETNTILVAGGAAATSKFEGYKTVFGTFPPTKKYLAQAIEALAKSGAQTAASIWEEASFTKGVCAALPELAEQHGLIVQTQTEVQASPTFSVHHRLIPLYLQFTWHLVPSLILHKLSCLICSCFQCIYLGSYYPKHGPWVCCLPRKHPNEMFAHQCQFSCQQWEACSSTPYS